MSVLRNPALLLAWGLPAVAVAASFLTLAITLRNPDGQLPEQYHWEGFQLDRDFTRAARAGELGVQATLTHFGESGQCEAELRMKGAPPDELVLLVAHATLSRLDQRVTFNRVHSAGQEAAGKATYSGACQPAVEGHWRLELVDAVNDWSVRQNVRGSLAGATINAVTGQSG